MTESKATLIFVALLAILFWNGAVCADDEPALPMGLGNDEPALPFGLGEETESEPVREQEDSGEAPFDLTGFVEVRGGIRTQRDRNERDASIGETRVQLETERELGPAVFSLTTDLLYDPVYDHHSIYLKRGLGWLDLREANVSIPVTEFMDAKVGRQILTWGTGDMLFVNDLFPKDWNSYFIGRDVEYLKAPSDAGKLSLYSGMVNVDLVYVPRFDADRYIDGTRLSYWNGAMGRRAGQNAVVNVDKRDEWLEDDEISLRLFRNVAGYELAAYGYHGFWKSPAGMNTASGEATFPELTVYGASGRGSVGRGIGNIEVGYYDSEDDHRGNDATVRNGEARVLAGYEQEVARDFTVGAQYYIEHMMGHDSYRHALPLGSKKTDEDRHVLTLRLTKLMMKQNLTMSLFTYYSPSDKDAYFRPNAHYKVTDNWAAEIGGNIFVGEDDHTFFGQFEKNNNIYTGLRYSF